MTSEIDLDELELDDYAKLCDTMEIYFDNLNDYTFENVISCKCNGDINLHYRYETAPYCWCTPTGKLAMIKKIEVAKMQHMFRNIL